MSAARYVVLEHSFPDSAHRPTHWDLMLDRQTHLQTWSLSSEPLDSTQIAATQLADHRRIYLDYEGAISQGRGHVRRWDAGNFRWLQQSSDCYIVQFDGDRLIGRVVLQRIDTDSTQWQFTMSPGDIGR